MPPAGLTTPSARVPILTALPPFPRPGPGAPANDQHDTRHP